MAAQTTHGPDLDLTTALPVARRRLAPWTVVVAVVVGVGVLLRTYTASATWLDETLTINIASLPLSRIPAALRLDGAPPLYYLLLHGWMRVFGSSDVAARSLSGLCSIATLPLMWAAGRRAAGPGGARAALLLLAASPFAIYYATEARMYALVVLLVTAGYLLLQRALTRPSMARLWPVAVVAGALALTHYWALFLLTAVALLLVWRICRGSLPGERRAARRCLLALAAGGVLFLPWLPIFVFQARHTGTPWAQPAQYSALVHAVGEWAGGVSTAARILGLLFLLLAVVGLLGRRMDERRMVIDLAPDGEATALGWVFAGTIVIALTAGLVAGSGFDGRYTSVAFPPFLLLTVRGVRALPQHAARPVLVLAVVAGLATALGNPVNRLKTDADLVAAAIRPTAQPADLVIYCPTSSDRPSAGTCRRGCTRRSSLAVGHRPGSTGSTTSSATAPPTRRPSPIRCCGAPGQAVTCGWCMARTTEPMKASATAWPRRCPCGRRPIWPWTPRSPTTSTRRWSGSTYERLPDERGRQSIADRHQRRPARQSGADPNPVAAANC